MKTAKWLFVYLVFTIVLLELSFCGLLQTGNLVYVVAIILTTLASSYTGFFLLEIICNREPDLHKDYYFYFINNNKTEEDFFFPELKRRI